MNESISFKATLSSQRNTTKSKDGLGWNIKVLVRGELVCEQPTLSPRNHLYIDNTSRFLIIFKVSVIAAWIMLHGNFFSFTSEGSAMFLYGTLSGDGQAGWKLYKVPRVVLQDQNLHTKVRKDCSFSCMLIKQTHLILCFKSLVTFFNI